jgi:hypothetical protein
LKDDFLLSLWIPTEAWNAYEEMRKKIKRPMTAYAKKIAIRKLDKLRREGNDPGEVLDQSTFNCWQGLYPIVESSSESRAEENETAIKRAFGKGTH